MSISRYSVFCLLVTDASKPSGDALVIHCSPDVSVAYLLDEVLNKCPDIRDTTPARFLIPWIPHMPFPSLPDTLSDHVKNLSLNANDKRTATRLDPGASLREYLPGPLPSRHVHVVIQLPAQPPRTVVGRKRPRGEDEEDKYVDLTTRLTYPLHVRDTSQPSVVAWASAFSMPKYQSTKETHS
jgi:hypothetical protein